MYTKLLLLALLISNAVLCNNYSTPATVSFPPLLQKKSLKIKTKDCPVWKPKCYGTIEFDDGSIYIGEISFGQPQGKGTMKWEDGSMYTGNFVKGLKEGHGEMIYPDGTKYEGDWKANKMSGRGAYVWSCGHEYLGEFKNDTMNGQGAILLVTGEHYNGGWKNGQTDGFGVFTRIDGSQYIGMNSAGLRNGPGMIAWQNGDTLKAQWVTGQIEGRGELIYENGDKLLFNWKKGEVEKSMVYTCFDDEKQFYLDIAETGNNENIQGAVARNLQLAFYTIGLEYMNENKYEEAELFLELASEIQLNDPNEEIMIAFHLNHVSQLRNESGWALKNKN